jgi:hypothetical protein
MADTTANYALPYPESTDAPEVWSDMQNLAEGVDGALDGVQGLITEQLTTYNTFSTSPIQPLVSAANTDTVIATVSASFKQGYAYEISHEWTAQFTGGTSPFSAFSKIRRTNAAGTVIDDMGGTTATTTNFCRMRGSVVVKCTAGNTTQTIALVGGFSTTGSPTSMDVEAASTRRTRLSVRVIGYAADHSGALEVPTA